jgi:ribonuclease HI
VADAVTNGWIYTWVKKRFKGKKNPDLWLRFLEVYKKHNVKFVWLKGHNDNPCNEYCDRLAVAASLQPDLQEDTGYQPE